MLLQEIFVNLKLNVLCREYFFKMFLQARLSVDKLGEHFPACSGKIREVGLPFVGFSFFSVTFCYILVEFCQVFVFSRMMPLSFFSSLLCVLTT